MAEWGRETQAPEFTGKEKLGPVQDLLRKRGPRMPQDLLRDSGGTATRDELRSFALSEIAGGAGLRLGRRSLLPGLEANQHQIFGLQTFHTISISLFRRRES
jgi:hypothetical protein